MIKPLMTLSTGPVLDANFELSSAFLDLKAAVALIAPIYILIVLASLLFPVAYILKEGCLQVFICAKRRTTILV